MLVMKKSKPEHRLLLSAQEESSQPQAERCRAARRCQVPPFAETREHLGGNSSAKEHLKVLFFLALLGCNGRLVKQRRVVAIKVGSTERSCHLTVYD